MNVVFKTPASALNKDKHAAQITPKQAIKIAVGALKNGDLENAESICNQIMKTSPRYAEGLFLMGLIEARKGRLSMSDTIMGSALDIDPNLSNAERQMEKIHQARKEARSHSYLQNFLQNRLVYMDYPRNIGIETTGYCGAKCNFCPHGSLDRRYTKMSDDLFERIIRELRDIPPHIPTTLFPNHVNEPFMDKKIMERLETIYETVPHMNIILFTNFNLIPKGFFERIWEIKNIIGLNVSLNSANEAEYRKIMGIDLSRTVKHIRRFLKENRKRRFLQFPVLLSRVKDHTSRDEKFIPECRSQFAGFEYGIDYQPQIKNRTDWIGNIDGDQSPVPSLLPCGAWFDINIFCNGLVPHCCMDSKGEYSIGDINENSLLEIYNNKKFRNYRETMIARETAYPCNTCSLLQ